MAEPTRSGLARLPHITAKVIGQAADRIKAKGLGTGALVQEIRAASDAAVVNAAKRREREAAAHRAAAEKAETAKVDAASRAAEETRRAEEARVLAALSPEDLETGRHAVLGAMTEGQRYTYEKLPVAGSQTLRRRVAAWAVDNGRVA